MTTKNLEKVRQNGLQTRQRANNPVHSINLGRDEQETSRVSKKIIFFFFIIFFFIVFFFFFSFFFLLFLLDFFPLQLSPTRYILATFFSSFSSMNNFFLIYNVQLVFSFRSLLQTSSGRHSSTTSTIFGSLN